MTMLVNCAAGTSRSATTAAVLLATREKLSLETAVEAITEFRSRANPHAALARLARSYLADVPGVPESGAFVASRADAPTEGPASGVWEPDDRE